MIQDNPVTAAVDIVGGPTQASFICRVSAAAIYKWRKEGWVQDSRAAVLLARATQEKGEPVSVAALAGLDVLIGSGGEPKSITAKGGRRRGHNPRSNPSVKTGIVSVHQVGAQLMRRRASAA